MPVGNAKPNGQILPDDIATDAAGERRDRIRRVFERDEYPYKARIRRSVYEKQVADVQVELLKVQVRRILVLLREVAHVPHFVVAVLVPHVVLLEVRQIPLYLQNLW